jgi:hypothetical protein
MVSLDIPGFIAVSAPAQVFAHISEIARRSTAMHGVQCFGGPVLNLTVAERANMSVLQAAAFSTQQATTVIILSRSEDPVLAVTLRLADGFAATHKSLAHIVHYAADDPGGWALMNASTALDTKFPWASGPIPTTHSIAQTSSTRNAMGLELKNGAGLYIIELSSGIRKLKTDNAVGEDEAFAVPTPEKPNRTRAKHDDSDATAPMMTLLLLAFVTRVDGQFAASGCVASITVSGALCHTEYASVFSLQPKPLNSRCHYSGADGAVHLYWSPRHDGMWVLDHDAADDAYSAVYYSTRALPPVGSTGGWQEHCDGGWPSVPELALAEGPVRPKIIK